MDTSDPDDDDMDGGARLLSVRQLRLFDLLHAADANDAARIAIAPIPAHGIGEAINDRLRRAAHR